jgi:Fe2+ or Zn2+ uptake regulation protein
MYDKYVELLRERSIKITPQRLEILKYLDNNRNHPTADRIYKDLKKNNPSLSKTTVYNSLEILKKHKIIHTISITGLEARYDIVNTIHHHFMCKKCGRIIDIDIECPNIKKTMEQGHKIEEVHGYFKGRCRECIECMEKEIDKYGS